MMNNWFTHAIYLWSTDIDFFITDTDCLYVYVPDNRYAERYLLIVIK